MTLSEFIQQSYAEKQIGCLWTIYVDGDKRLGQINNCYGETEYDAKEDAYEFYNSLKQEIDKCGN